MKKCKKSRIRYMALLLVLILTVGALAGCSKDKNKDDGNDDSANNLDKVILTIDDKDYTLQDIMYCLYVVESEGANEIMSGMMTGNDASEYWDELGDDGKTNREQTKDSVIKLAEEIILLEQKAKEEGYELSKDELDIVDEDVTNVLENLSDHEDMIERTGFTKEKLTELVKQYNLAAKYITDKSASMKVDENKVKDDLSSDAFAQVEVEYVLFVTGEFDEDGNYNLYGAEDISQILKNAQAAYKEIENGADFETVGKKYAKGDYPVDYGTQPLYKDPEQNDENLYNAFKDLKVGELHQGVIETDDGYYIIRMVNDNCTEAYDQELQDQLSSARVEAFEEEFSKTVAEHKIKINEENWALVEVGNYAFPELDYSDEENFDYDEDNSGFDIPINPSDDGAVG